MRYSHLLLIALNLPLRDELTVWGLDVGTNPRRSETLGAPGAPPLTPADPT